jgi:hypothetical protein
MSTHSLKAIDLASARLTQARAITNLLEDATLEALEDGRPQPAVGIQSAAEVLWAIRTLLEQAQEAVNNINQPPTPAAAA